MSGLAGDPALRWLARAKLRGVIRRQLSRLRTPAGAFFALFGVGLLGLWSTSVIFTFVLGRGPQLPPELVEPGVRFGLFGMLVISLAGNLANRGLYLPGSEVERVFSAPVRRSDIIRYRLNAGLGRSAFGGMFLALVAGVRLPHPIQAASASLLAVAFIVVLGQGLALVLGYVEFRLSLRWMRGLSKILFVSGLIGVGFGTWLVTQEIAFDVGRSDEIGTLTREALERVAPKPENEVFEKFEGLLLNPVVQAVTSPFLPWAKLTAAPTLPRALPWFALCVALLLFFYEAVARLNLDFREMAIDGSADVARRLRRMQRLGPGASASDISKRAATRRVPWLFGRGPAGAVAWRKTASIWRRARTTITFAALVLTFVVALNVFLLGRGNPGEKQVIGAFITAGLGVLYLCGGLRFDFREEVDRLAEIKAWPIGRTKLFTAMLLPEMALVVGLLWVAVALQVSIQQAPHLSQLGLALFLPPFVLLWLAIDNALFLKWPVRLVPGHDGALQNMGRASVLFVVRAVALGSVIALCAGGGAFAYWQLLELGLEKNQAGALAFLLAWAVLWPLLWMALWLGGRALASYDPARDRV